MKPADTNTNTDPPPSPSRGTTTDTGDARTGNFLDLLACAVRLAAAIDESDSAEARDLADLVKRIGAALTLVELQRTLRSVRHLMTTDARDWSLGRRDAWLYGTFVGWDEDSLDECAVLHGWDRVSAIQLREHAEVIRVFREGRLAEGTSR